MPKFCLSLFLFTFFILGGCSSDSGTNSKDTVIMPLKIGNTWTGKLWTLVEGSQNYYERPGIYRISNDTSYDNATWYVMDRIIDGDTTSDYFIFRNETNGLNALYEIDSQNFMKALWAKHPASVGDEYLSGLNNIETVTVTTVDTVVNVAYGDFICTVYRHEYESTSGPKQEIYYLGPNIGLVKIEFFQTDIDNHLYMNQMWELEIYQGSKSP
ncbi:MAG: hypothetical protein AB1746_15545 [Candidatus Zixiibacteriota bacterium]